MIIPRLNMQCRWNVGGKSRVDVAPDMFYLDHARSGIVLALQALQLPPHSRVGMMVYNCDTVMNAIASAGHDVVFVDVTRELTIDMEHLAARAQDMQVLIVTHLFGIVNDIAAIRARFPHLIIIEDCAHAMGCACGREGDFAVYSIGQGKFPSIGQGGILHVNNETYHPAIRRMVEELPQDGWGTMIREYAKNNIFGLLSKPWVYGLFTQRLKNKNGHEVDKASIQPKRMSRLVQGWYEQEKPRITEYVAQQIRNVDVWKEYLQQSGVVCTCLDTQNGFMLPVWMEQPLCKFIGIETATHFAQCIEWARAFGYTGDCPCAEDMVKHLTMLPCYYTLKEKQLKKQLYGK